MELLQLPAELLVNILEHVLYCVGIRGAVRLGITCRTFRKHILHCIYALPTFERQDDQSPPHLTWDVGMGRSLITGLILAKLGSSPDRRFLTSEIKQTLQFVNEILPPGDALGYDLALVDLAADSLPIPELLRRLALDTHGNFYKPCPPQNALATALHMGNLGHVQIFLAHGAKVNAPRSSFGDVLTIAACRADRLAFDVVLRIAVSQRDDYHRRLVGARLVLAIETAAASGASNVFCTDIWDLLRNVAFDESPYVLYGLAIKSALINDRSDMVEAITRIPDVEIGRWATTCSTEIVVETLRLACSENYEKIVSTIIAWTNVLLDQPQVLELLLEDASRNGHLSIVRALIACCTPPITFTCQGAIYWAARRSHWDLLSALFTCNKASITISISTALCGAAALGPSGLSTVLDVAEACCDINLHRSESLKSFSQTVDALFSHNAVKDPDVLPTTTDAPSASEDFFDEFIPQDTIPLRRACSKGDLAMVQQQLTDDSICTSRSLDGVESCFSAAIRGGHASLLLYLCQKLPHCRYFSTDAALAAQSTAIFQILIDEGWDINGIFARLKPPPLAWVVHSEILSRWFLDHGADPNARCAWDITPLSNAIRTASWSTISLLIERGGDVRKGQLLHFAVERTAPGQLAILDWLLACGAPINSRMFEDDPESWLENCAFGMGTPLHKAAELNNHDVATFLLDRGADTRVHNSNGQTAYDIATNRGHQAMARLLQDSASTRHD